LTHAASISIPLALGAGVLVTVIAGMVRIPAVLLLLGAGVVLGSSGIGVVDGNSLGPALPAIITAAIGLLVFEGGLHLDRHELSRSPRALTQLLTFGVLITFVGCTLLAHFAAGFSWPIAAVLASVLIVTGPTVIQPILRRLPVSPRLHAALAGEAILIDPIGVIIAVTVLEVAIAYLTSPRDAAIVEVGWRFLRPFVLGSAVGLILGLSGLRILTIRTKGKRAVVSTVQMFALAICMLAVGLGELVAPEAGLVAAAVCGIAMAHANFLGVSEMRLFKEQLATILVGMLFILLASRIDLRSIAAMSAGEWLFIAGVVFLVRPANAAVSTVGSKLTRRERTFLAFFAPRGIVAAAVASLAAQQLAAVTSGTPGSAVALEAARLEPLVFMVIVVTVVVAAGGGPVLGRILKVRAPVGQGVVIVGSNPVAAALAVALKLRDIPVHLVDKNPRAARLGRDLGFEASVGDATDSRWMDDEVLSAEMGWVVPLTGNTDVDTISSRWGEESFGPGRIIRPISGDSDERVALLSRVGGAIEEVPVGDRAVLDLVYLTEKRRVIAKGGEGAKTKLIWNPGGNGVGVPAPVLKAAERAAAT